ncbi:MAG: tRNA (guanosine(46)-N7)-methyltransferase TrmB [Treponema sp.]|jgi:tRNA (guanine-N7-)-methyltransferase|nr:tRNA (guanosine(46)-N7)-methyltransferase TrmB [Treponema sp.]
MPSPSAEQGHSCAYAQGRRVRSYVLRAGRATAAQRRSYDSLAEQFIVPFTSVPADFRGLFGNGNPLTVEIGFGMGVATAIIAAANPGKNYLGLEVHRPGIGRLLWEIEKRSLSNIRIIEHDAVEVFERMIPPLSLEAVHIFFPDPWPKKRHHKRRLVKRPFTETLARGLKPGAYLYMVTDWEDYGNWALAELGATGGLVNAYQGFAPPRTWRPKTKFEQKGLAKNHLVKELVFRKADR